MAKSIGGLLALGRIPLIIVVTLVVTWSIAHILPQYSESIATYTKAQLARGREKLPSVHLDFHPDKDPRTAFNTSKLALLIEARPTPHLVPLLTHMMYVVPPDWRFLFIGSNKSVIAVGRSFATQFQQVTGKLDLMVMPKPWEVNSKEDVYRVMTDKRFYDEFLPGVEWLLKFEADAIMCGNSEDSLDAWLEYDWAGAPRNPNDQFAGNGGLSLRRVSAVKKVLEGQVRENNTTPEDEWFGRRMVNIPGMKVASALQEESFSVEDSPHEKPIGYHVRESGKLPTAVWKNMDKRMDIFHYCPEITMIMDMKMKNERCPGDKGDGEFHPKV